MWQSSLAALLLDRVGAFTWVFCYDTITSQMWRC